MVPKDADAKAYEPEYINDSGCTTYSQQALCDQGVRKAAVDNVLGQASDAIDFDTGGGIKAASPMGASGAFSAHSSGVCMLSG